MFRKCLIDPPSTSSMGNTQVYSYFVGQRMLVAQDALTDIENLLKQPDGLIQSPRLEVCEGKIVSGGQSLRIVRSEDTFTIF